MNCEICRNPCKEQVAGCKKGIPKDEHLGCAVHFQEDPNRHYGRHEKTSRMCVVCKDYFHFSKIVWRRLMKGLYSFCPECAP
jgi:hypothetical protein